MPVPKGWFRLKNGEKVYITYSEFGHYPGKKGKRIVEEIRKVKPKYLLVETHSPKVRELILPSKECYDKEMKIPDEKRSDIGWAIIAGNKVGATIIGFDLPQDKFLAAIHKSFKKYSEELAILNTIAHPVCSRIWHCKSTGEEIKLNEIYKRAESYLLKFSPKEVSLAIKRKGIKKLFKEWLDFLDLTLKEILDFDEYYLSLLLHFIVRFPSRKVRDKHMIRMIKRFAKKGKTAVVVGSGHIDRWIKYGWIEKV